MAQLMPLPLTVSCFNKIQIGFTFLVPAHLGSPGKGRLNGCVCVQLSRRMLTTWNARVRLPHATAAERQPTYSASAGLLLLAYAGTDRQTPYCFTDPAPHTMRAVPMMTGQQYADTSRIKLFTGLTLFVAGEYPDLHLGKYEVRDGLRHAILQLVLDGASTNQRKVLLYLIVHCRQPALAISHCHTGHNKSLTAITLFTHVYTKTHTHTHTHTQTHPFNCPFSGPTWVSRYQKGKTNLDFTEARDSEWQWHQLGHMQVCISLQTTMPAPHHSVFYRPDAFPVA